MRPGPRNLITDVAGIAVGQAEDARARTGVSVILPDERAVAAVDVRGGGPGTRETDAGVVWTAAGENIGEGGPVTDSPSAIAQMAVLLTQDMLNEVPPDDGHRLNILSTTFTHIGIAVYRDPSGTVWMTQDFSN